MKFKFNNNFDNYTDNEKSCLRNLLSKHFDTSSPMFYEDLFRYMIFECHNSPLFKHALSKFLLRVDENRFYENFMRIYNINAVKGLDYDLSYIFEQVDFIKEADLSSIEYIPHGLFALSDIEKIRLKDAKHINSYAFSECRDLKEVEFGNKLETISAWAFRDDKKLASITLPKSLKSLSPHAFESCRPVRFQFNGTAQEFDKFVDSINGLIFQTEDGYVHMLGDGKKLKISSLRFE